MTVLAAEVDHTSSQPLLVVAALLGIAVVVVLITVFKVHPFLALILGSAVLGVVAGVGVSDIVASFTAGVGNVGLLIALGAMIGGLLTASGGADGWSTGSSTGSARAPCPGRWAGSPR
jgi:gluconate:H+ symporter, GntP family